jgi:hypothetical protein
MKQKKKPTAMSSLLSDLIQKKGWKKQINRNKVFLIWEQIVGPEIAHHAQPQVIRGKVLWVNVSDSVWIQQLQFQKIMLLEQLNHNIHTTIEDIRFSIDSSLDRPLPEHEPPALIVDYQPDPEKKAQMEKLFSSVDDKEVRQAMKRLWLKLDKAGASRK